ncbi:MAG: lysophospholipase [Clostridiales bacterium]|nr:lysophospholipase [Clostridiales bacterium]
MKRTEFTLVSKVDALPLSCILAEPEGEAKGLILMAHGLMEYKERFLPLMQAFSENGFACAINDQRGYGKSVRSREDEGFSYGAGAKGVVQDMHQLAEELVGRYPSKKLFLYGHSMGALCAMCFLKQYGGEVSGAILASLPAYNPAVGAGKTYLKLRKRLKGAHYRDESISRLMTSSFSARFMGESSPFSWLNSDPEQVKKYEEDPGCGNLGTIDGYITLLELMSDAYDKKGWNGYNQLMPVFIAAGADDPCADGEQGAAKGESYLKTVGYARAEHRSYPGMRHELHFERNSATVINDMLIRLNSWA